MTDPFPTIPTAPDGFELPDVGTGAAEKRYQGEPTAGATDRPQYAQNGTWLNRDAAAATPSFVPAGGPAPSPLEAGAVRAQIDEAPILPTATVDPPPLAAPAHISGVAAAVSGTFEDAFDPDSLPAMFAGAVDATPTEEA